MAESGADGGAAADGRIVSEGRGRVFLIGIDRPAKLNGFSPKMVRELAEAYTQYERDDAYWCALLYAEGDNFTAGIELDRFDITGTVFPPGLVDPFGLRPPVPAKPVVAAVHGICFTMGIELMLAADIVVAAEGTRFSQLEVKRGLSAFGGATIRMVERAGWGDAMRYLLTGDEFGPQEALRLGFVQEVVPKGQQGARAFAIAEAIASRAPLAVRETKASARLALDEGPATAVAAFGPLVARLKASEDFAEGVRSFSERREARFSGR